MTDARFACRCPDPDNEGCWCPDDVLWGRLLGDDDPCAPGKDWVAAAFGSLDDDDGCDCTELCSMGPTCPGGMLGGLRGSGCWRSEVAPEVTP